MQFLYDYNILFTSLWLYLPSISISPPTGKQYPGEFTSEAEMDNHDSLKVSSFSLHSWTALEWHFIMLLETSRNRSYWRCNSAMWCCHKHSESSNFLHLPIYTPLSEQFLTLQTYKHKFFPMYRKKFMFMFLCLYVYVYLPGYVCSGILFNAWSIICHDKGLH